MPRRFGTSEIHRWTWTHLAPTVALLLIAVLPVSAEDAPNSGGVTLDGPANNQKTSDGTSSPEPAVAPAPASEPSPPPSQQESKAPVVAQSIPVLEQEHHTQNRLPQGAPSNNVASVHQKAQMLNDIVFITTNPYSHSTSTLLHPETAGNGGGRSSAIITTHKSTTSLHPHLTTTHVGTTTHKTAGAAGESVSHRASSAHQTSSSHSSSHPLSGGLPSSIYSGSHSSATPDTLPFSIYSGSQSSASAATDTLPFSIASASDPGSASVGVTGTGSVSQSQSDPISTPATQSQPTAISHTGIIPVSDIPISTTPIPISTTTTSHTDIPTTTATSAQDKGGVNHSGISPGGVVGIVFGVLAALIIFTVCICCLPRRLRQRRWNIINRTNRYNVDPQIHDDAENLRSSNPYAPEVLSGYASPASAVMRERDGRASASYPGITSTAAWGLGPSAADRRTDQYAAEPRGLISPPRVHDPFSNYTYAGGNNDNNHSAGFGGQRYNNDNDMPLPNPYTNVALERGSPPRLSPPHSSSSDHDMATTYPAVGSSRLPSYAGGGDDSDAVVAAALIDRNMSAGSRKSGVGKRSMRKKFKYRPNSTLTEEERYDAAGTLSRIESTSRERDEAYEGIMQERGANRLRGGAPSVTHSGSSSSSSFTSNPSPSQSPVPSRPVLANRISSSFLPTRTGSVYYESFEDMIQQPLSTSPGVSRVVTSPPSSYGWGNRARLRGDSDAEMSRLLDLLVNRSATLPDKPPAPLQMVSETSFASSSDVRFVEGFHDHEMGLSHVGSGGMSGDEHADAMSNRTFGQESLLSARGGAPKVTVTPTSPTSASLKERWQRKYGRPI
ncbi:hypothetical protein FRB93_006142 [Tulasnella sp. JGI-2019a]|nr:hypothetical protein FRB93_006142 [Tulasnella sp. JGI-2019a]